MANNNDKTKRTAGDYTYVGRRPCGCVAALAVDYMDRATGDFVGDMIAGGLTVERVKWDEVKDDPRYQLVSFKRDVHLERQLELV